MTTYSIKSWSEVFENYKVRPLKHLSWVSLPTRQDSEAFVSLMRTEDGVLAYGVFVALVQWAARCPERGLLVDDRGVITPERFSTRFGTPVACIRKAWGLLASVGWLQAKTETAEEQTDIQTYIQSGASAPGVGALATEHGARAPDPGALTTVSVADVQRAATNGFGHPDEPPGFREFWRLWPKGGRKAGREKCCRRWKALKLETQAGAVHTGLRAWKASLEWRKDNGQFIPAPMAWINDQRWEANPERDPEAPAPYDAVASCNLVRELSDLPPLTPEEAKIIAAGGTLPHD